MSNAIPEKIETPFTKRLGIQYPIICGPMFPCSNPELVAAVSEAGGIGIIQPLSLVYVYGYEMRAGIKKIRSLTSKPFGMNIIVERSSKTYETRMQQYVDIALEEGCRFFITSLGSPQWVVDKVKPFGGIVYHDVTNKNWAERALKCGIDGFVCVNNRAGAPDPAISSTASATPSSSVAPPADPDAGVASPVIPAASFSTPVTGHPRIWFRAEDLPRLRSWATDKNPMWVAMKGTAERAKKIVDDGKLPDAKGCHYSQNYCETYAEVFAFMSLVHPDANARADYQARAKKMLMTLIDRMDKCADGEKLCDKRTITYNRSEWAGEAFPLTVDWIYPALSADDKKTIRSDFLKWSEILLHATVTGANHPEPIGVLNDPKLLQHKVGVRYGCNNYYVSHMRNLTYMSLALDEADDPAEEGQKRQYPRMRDYLANATGAWLYRTDAALRGDCAGGAAVEGVQYGAETLAFIAQTHLGLLTAGQMNPTKYGPQVVLENVPFWQDHIKAFVHSMSPGAKTFEGWEGPHYVATWWGDGQSYEVLDFIDSFAALGLYAQYTGNAKLLNAARWIETNMAPGGAELLHKRATASNGGLNFRMSIFYFLLFDPNAPAATDPRPELPLDHFAPGLGQLFSRTSWKEDATWFHYMIGWENIDHRHGDGNHFDLYRNGEWLTKERMGYGEVFQLSDQHNTLTLENDPPAQGHGGETRKLKWERGSQWTIHHHEDPALLAHSFAPSYVYGLGDSTGLYNASGEHIVDVKHASRSILWVKPDFVVTYDRATTGKADRFKRYWLQTQEVATVNGAHARAETKHGQQLFISALLPKDAVISAEEYKGGDKYPFKRVAGEPMKATMHIEPAKNVADIRFLTVLEGADKGAVESKTQLVVASQGALEGAIFKDSVALFPKDVGPPPAEVRYVVPATVGHHFVTGLAPSTAYEVTRKPLGANVEVDIKVGGGQKSDEGGVLAF